MSAELVRRKREEMLGGNVWEHLYSLDRAKQDRRDQTYLERKLQLEEAKLRDCTFRPQIQATPQDSMESVSRQEGGDIYERTRTWKKGIEEKIQRRKDNFEKEEEKSCVFRPELSAKVSDVHDVPVTEIKGVAKFFERQKVASEARKEKELYQRRDIGTNWVRKVTVPAEFNLTNPATVFPFIGRTHDGRSGSGASGSAWTARRPSRRVRRRNRWRRQTSQGHLRSRWISTRRAENCIGAFSRSTYNNRRCGDSMVS